MLHQTEQVGMVDHPSYAEHSAYQESFVPPFTIAPIPAQSKPLQPFFQA